MNAKTVICCRVGVLSSTAQLHTGAIFIDAFFWFLILCMCGKCCKLDCWCFFLLRMFLHYTELCAASCVRCGLLLHMSHGFVSCLSDGMKQLNHSRCLGCRPPPKNPFRLGWAEERNHVACLLDGGTYGASWQIQLNDLNTFSTEVLDAAYPRSSVLSLLARNLFLISCSALGLYACERL